jgi:hypothetical protein
MCRGNDDPVRSLYGHAADRHISAASSSFSARAPLALRQPELLRAPAPAERLAQLDPDRMPTAPSRTKSTVHVPARALRSWAHDTREPSPPCPPHEPGPPAARLRPGVEDRLWHLRSDLAATNEKSSDAIAECGADTPGFSTSTADCLIGVGSPAQLHAVDTGLRGAGAGRSIVRSRSLASPRCRALWHPLLARPRRTSAPPARIVLRTTGRASSTMGCGTASRDSSGPVGARSWSMIALEWRASSAMATTFKT